MVNKIHIAPTMFSQTMDNDEYRFWCTLRQPALMIDVGITTSFEKSLLMYYVLSPIPTMIEL